MEPSIAPHPAAAWPAPLAAPQPAAPAPADAATVIRFDEVTRRYDGMVAVDGLSLAVPEGTILGMIGPSGSGKTTTVRMATGTLEPTFGEIEVLGERPSRFSRRARERIAYMPQLFSLYLDLTAEENVNFVAGLFGIVPWKRSRLIRRALETVDLWPARHRLARDLSGGMQRRLELACALVHAPSVLFLDEPTAGVDPMLRLAIWRSLRELRDQGRTLLVTTQYVSDAEYCDRVVLLDHGAMVALDEPDALRRSAYGGDVLRIDTQRPVDPDVLATVEGLSAVRQQGPHTLMAVTESAGMAAPRVVEALGEQGIGVVSVEEYQPTYDDAFAILVQRHREQRERERQAAESESAETQNAEVAQ
ncbi:MAG TPA: ABC transporter ATP-binding protein [Candidatus Limnocylindria bacterium]|nr:ABC transporter ATP-binding protein [Candidatus Limnocylindria bacterium]